MAPLHGPVHSGLCGRVNNGQCVAGVPRAHHSHLDEERDEVHRVGNWFRLAARLFSARGRRLFHRVDVEAIPAASVDTGVCRTGIGGPLMLAHTLLHQLLGYNDSHFGHLLWHRPRGHGHIANTRLFSGRQTHVSLW